MDVAVCFSGGTDSALAALLLEPFYDVTLVSGRFGVLEDATPVTDAAEALGLPLETVALDREVAVAAVDRMVADGFPRNGIQQVHEHMLEVVADETWDAVADGTRRDDRVPRLDRAAARSLEDRHGVAYLAPLAGVGRSAIDAMASERLAVETGPSETLAIGDYEAELRALLAVREDAPAVADVFPDHTQSRVTGRRAAGEE